MLPRNKKSLKLLSGWCRPMSSRGQRPCRVGEEPPLDRSAVARFLEAHEMSLVWVRLSLLSKGKPEVHAMVCVPTTEDLQLLSKGPGSGGPREPPHRDHVKGRIKHKKKKKKKKATTTSTVDSSEDPEPPSGFTPGLWPDPLPSVSSHCSRVTLGWVTQGDFSLSAGCGEALGFVSLAGLLGTLTEQPREHRGVLLLRNPASLHYRFAKVNIEVWWKAVSFLDDTAICAWMGSVLWRWRVFSVVFRQGWGVKPFLFWMFFELMQLSLGFIHRLGSPSAQFITVYYYFFKCLENEHELIKLLMLELT